MQTQKFTLAGSPLAIFVGTLAFLVETVAGYKDGDSADIAEGLTKAILEGNEEALTDFRELLLQTEGAHNILVTLSEPEDPNEGGYTASDHPEDGVFVDESETTGQTSPETRELEESLAKINAWLGLPTSDPNIKMAQPPVSGMVTDVFTPSESEGLRRTLAEHFGVDPKNVVLTIRD